MTCPDRPDRRHRDARLPPARPIHICRFWRKVQRGPGAIERDGGVGKKSLPGRKPIGIRRCPHDGSTYAAAEVRVPSRCSKRDRVRELLMGLILLVSPGAIALRASVFARVASCHSTTTGRRSRPAASSSSIRSNAA